MDFIADFFPFILLLLYAVLQLLRRKRGPETTAPEGEGLNDAPKAQTDLDDLAKHLEALITGSPVEAKPPPPAPEPRYDPEFISSEVDVDESASFRHSQHGYGAENPLSEEIFEQRPAFAPSRPRRDTKKVFDPHGLKRPSAKPKAPASPWMERLGDPKRAREAIVIQTILERPRDRKR